MAKKTFLELGASGTSQHGGYITEDYSKEWQGEKKYEIIDQMRKGDATVKSVLRAVKLPIQSAKWEFVPASPEKRDLDIAEACRWQFFECLTWPEFLRHALLMVDCGNMLFERCYGIKDDKIIYTKLAPRLPKSVQKWQMSDGKPGITQYAVKDGRWQQINIPWEKLFHIAFDQEGDNYEGESILRAAYKHWYYRENDYKIQAIAGERCGTGLPVATIPDGKKLDDKAEKELTEFLENVRANEKSYVKERGGVTFRLETVAFQYDFQPQINHHDRQVSKAILSQFIEIGVTLGGNAQNASQQDFFFMGLKAVAELLRGKVQQDLVQEFVNLNFNDVTAYPQLTVSGIGDADSLAFASVLEKLVNSGIIEPDRGLEDFTRRRMSLPDRDEDTTIQEEETPEDDAPDSEDDAEDQIDDVQEEKKAEKNSREIRLSFDPPRTLTLAEEKVDWGKLEALYGKIQAQIEGVAEMHSARLRKKYMTNLEEFMSDPATPEVLKRGIATLAANMGKELAEITVAAFEAGKTAATNEMGLPRFATPATEKQFLRTQANLIAERHADDLRTSLALAAHEIIKQGGIKPKIREVSRNAMETKAKSSLPTTAGILTSGSITGGIGTAYDRYAEKIFGYQWSSVLDGQTTDYCQMMDGKVVLKKEEMPPVPAHYNCRSRIVAVMLDQTEKPEVTGIPEKIKDNTADGYWNTKAKFDRAMCGHFSHDE